MTNATTTPGTGGGSGHRASAAGAPDRRGGIFRPSGLVVFALTLVLLFGAWWLFADRLVERSVEGAGTFLVGARVDLASADLRLTGGRVQLIGLEVTNPDSPMRNLVSADEIVADLRLAPLLGGKVVVEELTVAGVRFGTERTTSGALPEDEGDSEPNRLWGVVNEWAGGIQIPSFSLDNLGGVVRTEAISTDSLRTVQHARSLVTRGDSLSTDWERRLQALDPRPRIDSIAAVAQRMESFRPTPLNLTRVPGLVRDARAAVERVTSLEAELAALDTSVREGVASLSIGGDLLDSLRAEDQAYAMALLDIPSIEAPTISPALFAGTALDWLKPILYWTRAAERFLPPGLDPRNRPGPSRARASGTTYEFPEGAEYPGFLLEEGNVSLAIAGTGFSAGGYTATVRALTSSPALLGRPTEIRLRRDAGGGGVRGISFDAVLDHTGSVVRDSLRVAMDGVALPEVDLAVVGGRLGLGEGRSTIELFREGDRIEAEMIWTSDDLTWTGSGGAGATPLALGSADWARDLIWRTLSGIGNVELAMTLDGEIESPSLSVRSNLGDAVSESLDRELGREIEAAQARVRAEVDQRIQPVVQEATGRAEALRTEVQERVAAERREVEELRARMEARVRELTAMIPGGE